MKDDAKLRQMLEFAKRIRSKPVWPNISVGYISKELGVSQRKTSRMFSLFKKSGLVNFLALLDVNVLGLSKFLVIVPLDNTTDTQKLCNKLQQMPYIENISLIWGEKPSLILRANTSSNKMRWFMEELTRISRINISELKIVARPLIESGKKIEVLSPTKQINLDKIDIELLRLLREDATLTYRELGKTLNLTAPAIYTRLNKLKKEGVIQGYFCRIKTREVKSKIVSLCFIKINRAQISKFVQDTNTYQVRFRNLYELYDDYNLLCELNAPNTDELYRFLNNIISKYNIKNIKNNIVMKQWWTQLSFGISDIKSK